MANASGSIENALATVDDGHELALLDAQQPRVTP
jgi:hypothetical protein